MEETKEVSVQQESAAENATAAAGQPETQAPEPKKDFTRRQVVIGGVGIGLAGLIAGGVLAKWGVIEESIASGRVVVDVTPTKMIVTDRARCSGCQRCEMMCTLKNDSRVCQNIARVRVWPNYNFGEGSNGPDGIYRSCQFTVEHCKQCKDAKCMEYCPVHAIVPDPETGARTVNADVCIGCGMCSQACPWSMPVVDTETNTSTKCIACGRCAEQCPNGAIKFVDWQDIAQAAIDQGVLRTATLVPGA